MKPKKSILTDDFESCFLCGMPAECVHHIFFGNGKRQISDREGFTVPLCHRCHNMGDEAIHFNRRKDLILRQMCQSEYERTHSRREFMKLIGRNYL